MNDNLNIDEILNTLDSVKELYQNNISSKILEEEIALLNDNEENEVTSWGNKNSNILIIGSVLDSFFSNSSELFKNIIKNGMKLDENEIYFLKVQNHILEDVNKFKYVLCLGDNLKSILEAKLNSKFTSSSINDQNGIKFMPTYSITQVFHDKNIKRLFWNDLQNFLKEII